MIRKTISLDCGVHQLMQAREALGSTAGVLSAEVVTGQSALRVFGGDELSQSALMHVLTGCGLTKNHIQIH